MLGSSSKGLRVLAAHMCFLLLLPLLLVWAWAWATVYLIPTCLLPSNVDLLGQPSYKLIFSKIKSQSSIPIFS